jgi:hypothetical protein
MTLIGQQPKIAYFGNEDPPASPNLVFEIGRHVLDESGGAAVALRRYGREHAAEIILSVMLGKVEKLANHKELRETLVMLANELDDVSS